MSAQVFKLNVLACVFLVAHVACGQDVHIGVLGLFRPHEVTLKSAPMHAVVVQAGKKVFVLERSSGPDTAEIVASGDELTLRIGNESVRTNRLYASSRGNSGADFVLVIPGKMSRTYHGLLEVKVIAGILVPVVAMDLETAVASVVAAETVPDTPLEALKAQAVATRSYFIAARGRHHDFDFCDTTHCQFLREPPSPYSEAFHAALDTRGLVLAYRDQTVAAMFTRSCGGRTRTPQEIGLSSSGYPYFSAVCDYCLRQPSHWVRRIGAADAETLHAGGENSRLGLDRRLGWDAIPSNNFIVHRTAQGAILEGAGEGHGVGLCQAGAKAMAQSGATFREILDHYYPNTRLMTHQSSDVR